jgi:predicted RNase H-like HicB family nuclease
VDREQHYETGRDKSGEAMTEFTIVIEDAGSNFAAYAPDFPGCVAAADTIEETRLLMEEALALHLQMLRDMGEPIPTPHVRAAVVQVAS